MSLQAHALTATIVVDEVAAVWQHLACSLAVFEHLWVGRIANLLVPAHETVRTQRAVTRLGRYVVIVFLTIYTFKKYT
jgi:hypothetical protein